MEETKRDRKSFVFYRSFLGLFSLVKKSLRWPLFEALCAYALDGKEIELPAGLEGAMSAMKPIIDSNEQRYRNGKKGAPYGVLGGRQKHVLGSENKTPDVTPYENGKERETPKEKEREKRKASLDRGRGGMDPRAVREFFYQRRQDYAKRVAAEHHALAEQVSGFSETESALRRYIIASAKREARGEPVDVEEGERLHAKLKACLIEAGLTEEDLEPHWMCAKCSDTGFMPDGRPCDCYRP